jgi:hypothetical protein
MVDLRQINWMRQQWRSFRRLLFGAIGVIWLFCSVGIIWPHEQFWVRMSLLFMLLVSTLYALRLLWVTFRSLRDLDRRAAEIRCAEAASLQTQSTPSRVRAEPPG